MTATTVDATATPTGSSGVGRVARVIGPVVDIEFPPDQIPELYNALTVQIELSHQGEGESTHSLTLEVALRQAARVRLRPILMTTLCTLFGLVPLALGIGAGSDMQKPLALAVIGGLALSTPITLFLVPTLLVVVRGRGFTLAGRESLSNRHR